MHFTLLENLFMKYLLLFFVLVSLASCAFQVVEYKSTNSFSVSKISTKPEMKLNIKMYNPNGVGAKLRSMTLEVKVNDKFLGSVKLDSLTKVGARQDFDLPMTFNTDIGTLASFIPTGISSLIKGKELPIEFSGEVTIQKFIFRKKFSFDYKSTYNTKDISLF